MNNKYLISLPCKNPNCNNIFYIRKYDIGKKLYCCRNCRSEYHWLITPLFEKKCLNPVCDIIIKRKFKQKIDKINYCSPQCRKIHKEQIFRASLNDTIKSTCKECNKELIVHREPCGKLIPRKKCDVCNKRERQLQTQKMTEKFIQLYNTNEIFFNKMKNVHKLNGIKAKKHHKKFGLSKKWIEWYTNYSSLGKSKLEDKVYNYLKSKIVNIEIKRWHSISNMFVDFYIPDKNLVIECQGDYWHMNPIKYSATDYNKTTKKTAKEHWNKDRKRKLFMEKSGYKVVELWEDEINQDNYKKLDIYL